MQLKKQNKKNKKTMKLDGKKRERKGKRIFRSLTSSLYTLIIHKFFFWGIFVVIKKNISDVSWLRANGRTFQDKVKTSESGEFFIGKKGYMPRDRENIDVVPQPEITFFQ